MGAIASGSRSNPHPSNPLPTRRRLRRRFAVGAGLVALVWSAGVTPSWAQKPEEEVPSPALAIGFEDGGAVVSGVTPGASVAWMAAHRGLRGWVPTLGWEGRVVADDDEDGEVRFALEGLEQKVPRMSVWMVVDFATGEAALASPDGWRPRQLTLEAEPFLRGDGDKLDRVAQRSGELLVFLARPGETAPGLWELSVGDGNAGDVATEVGLIQVPVADLRPLGDSPPPPEELSSGDVVLLVHPRTLARASAVVGEAGLPLEGGSALREGE